ncbi:hypothetical protein IAT38_005044 [Cryptococcus sp. DSM 104549]
MDPDQAGDLARSIAAKFVSLDQVEFDSVINEYFDSNCTLDSPLTKVHGVTQVKKLTSLEAALAFKSRLVGPPHYDAEKGSISFTYERVFQPPTIPPSVPFAGWINTHLRKVRLHPVWDSELHLNPSNDEGGQAKLYVTKVGPRVKRGGIWWEQYLPYALLQPILSVLFILAADLYQFFTHHPVQNEGIISVFFAAFAGIWSWITGGTFDAEGKADGTKEALAWPLSVLSAVAHYTLYPIQITFSLLAAAVRSTAAFTRDTLQTDGSALVQVRNYLFQAFNVVYSNVRHLVWTILGRAEERARGLGVPVDDYRVAVEEGVRGVRQRVGEVFDEEPRTNGTVRTSTRSQRQASTSPGAPTYAEVAQE